MTAREIGESVVDILEAALEVAGGALATVVSILLRLLASYRHMTAQEIAEARIVFANTLDYDNIYFASESLITTSSSGSRTSSRAIPSRARS